MRDLLDASEEEWSAERARVAAEGWGARLFEVQVEDGQWVGGAHFPSDFDWPGPEAFQQGAAWFDLDGPPGTPSKWVTLRAMRVLRWSEA